MYHIPIRTVNTDNDREVPTQLGSFFGPEHEDEYDHMVSEKQEKPIDHIVTSNPIIIIKVFIRNPSQQYRYS